MIVSEVFMLQYGDTALHEVATEGKVEAVKALVDCGSAVDIRNEVQIGICRCVSIHFVL